MAPEKISLQFHPLHDSDKQIMLDAGHLTELITAEAGVFLSQPIEEDAGHFYGAFRLTVEEVTLEFTVEFLPVYPLQFHGHESIRFINQKLLQYSHVNLDGSICVHTLHSNRIEDKIRLDFEALRQWIIRYYINKTSDDHYEHIIVPTGNDFAYLFTNVHYTFTKGEFGFFRYTLLAEGTFGSKQIQTSLVLGFELPKQFVKCGWSSVYQDISSWGHGIFLFTDSPPVANRRFAVSSWSELETYVDQRFLYFLYCKSRLLIAKKNKPVFIPLLLGYNIHGGEIHWQVAHINLADIPNYGEKSTGVKYIGRLREKPIDWAQTHNCSYSYFFGRGMLHPKITQSRILIIGVGAIGSMVATSFVRGGCRQLYIVDYDMKMPENVCRSEYHFASGLTAKVQDLRLQLQRISPFVHVGVEERLSDALKFAIQKSELLDSCKECFASYDLIIDCSADYDMAYILDQLNLSAQVINLSVTNHAQDLVCVVSPNLYPWLMDIFKRLPQDQTDLYNPTGCWAPTFKASYTDIAVLVQYAIKHINLCFEKNRPLRHFQLATQTENEVFTVKLNQF